MSSGDRIAFALCAYSLPHSMGYLATVGGEFVAEPLTPNQLTERAIAMGLSGVEFPLMARAPAFDGKTVSAPTYEGDLKAYFAEYGLTLIADYGALLDYSAEETIAYMTYAAHLGARTVRSILSHLLCGDRRVMPVSWTAHLEAVVDRLKLLLPVADSLGISLAVENHQDASSADMIYLYEASGESPAFGVTLDTGNPLAVCEDPVEFTRAICPLIRHVHAKDYTLYFAPEGYRLVRCATGAGVVDFPEIMKLVGLNGNGVLPSIEIAAQATRTIPMLEDSWWACYPAEQASKLPAALRTVWRHARPIEEPYASRWEMGGSSEEIAAEEWKLVTDSVEYCRNLKVMP